MRLPDNLYRIAASLTSAVTTSRSKADRIRSAGRGGRQTSRKKRVLALARRLSLMPALLVMLGCRADVVAILTPPPAAAAEPRPASIPPLAARYARAIIGAWQQQWQVSESPATAFAQIHQESQFDCAARSPVGASGCAQFMPGTATWIQTVLPPEVRAKCPRASGCPLDPGWAFAALATFDRRLWNSYQDEPRWRQRWELTLGSYNGGPGWIQKERISGTCLRAAWACEETRGYLTAILDRYRPRYVAWLGHDQRSMP